jgi:hypothetical protein
MPVIKTFPTCVLPASVVRVHYANCLEARMTLGFGVTVTKRVIIEGIDSHRIPPQLRPLAKKAMVILVGGKSILVHADPAVQDGIVQGRVYLNEKVYDAPAGAMLVPYGLDQPLLEIGFFFEWLHGRNFNIEALKGVLNGHRPYGVEEAPVASDADAALPADPAGV